MTVVGLDIAHLGGVLRHLLSLYSYGYDLIDMHILTNIAIKWNVALLVKSSGHIGIDH